MRCHNCVYFWYDEYEEMEICHWESKCPGDLPPCEYNDEEEE